VETTGDYLFAISGDDQNVFYLSTDMDPANKQIIVSEPNWNGWRSWNTNDRRIGTRTTDPATNNDFIPSVDTLPINRSQNTTGAKTLTQGENYYFEVLSKEGGGGDSVAVTWWLDGETMPADNTPGISASNTSTFVNPDNTINISAQPVSTEWVDGEAGSVSVTANPTAPVLGGKLSYQWYKNGAPISGANGSSFNVSAAAAGDAGNYYVEINAPGAPMATSATAAITVGSGGEPPTLTIVNNGDGSVTVTYPDTGTTTAVNPLQSALNLNDPIDFQADTSGSGDGTTWSTTKATDTDDETYWRTAKP
jgi:hypothetical protein